MASIIHAELTGAEVPHGNSDAIASGAGRVAQESVGDTPSLFGLLGLEGGVSCLTAQYEWRVL